MPLVHSRATSSNKKRARPTEKGLFVSTPDSVVGNLKLRTKACADPRPGAVVIGGDYQGLGIVRSLGRHGVPVCVIDDEYSISRFSRYATFSQAVPSLRDEVATINLLLDLAHRKNLKGWVLFPTRDETVAALSRHRAELSAFYRVPTPGWGSIHWVWDKSNTYRLAQELGIPIPRTWHPQSLEELDQIDADVPLVIKPAIKQHFFYATKAKAWRANTRDELRRLFQKATALVGEGGVLVQDLVPGDGDCQFSYCAFFKGGRPIGSMTAKRRRQHPHEFGRASTYVETTEPGWVDTLSERLLQAIGYYGLVEVEYKLDPRDGQFRLLDVNGRTWGFHSLGCRAGVDFPYMLYADQIGEAVETCRAQPGISWIRLATDLPHGLREILAGRLNWRAYLRSLRSFDTEAVCSWEDPLPFLAELALIPYLSVKRGF